MNIIDIDKEEIPYDFDITLNGVIYNIGITWNNTAERFIVSLSRDGEIICAGEPIVYGQPLWGDIYISDDFPTCTITPKDEAYDEVTYDNFGDEVLLVVEDYTETEDYE